MRLTQVATPDTASELRNIDHGTTTCFGQRSQSGQTSCGKITHSVIAKRWPRRGLKTDSAQASHRSRGLGMIWEHSKGNDVFFVFFGLSRLQNQSRPSPNIQVVTKPISSTALSSAESRNVRLLDLHTVRALEVPDHVVVPPRPEAAGTALNRARKRKASQVRIFVSLQLTALVKALARLPVDTARSSTFVRKSMSLRVHAIECQPCRVSASRGVGRTTYL